MIRLIEELTMNAMPSLKTVLYDGWVIRITENSKSKRANSVYPVSNSTLPLEEKIDVCSCIYEKESIKTVFKITEDEESLKVDSLLEARGYEIQAKTGVMTMDIDNNIKIDNDVNIEDTMFDGWLDYSNSISNKSKEHAEASKKIYRNLVQQPLCASIIIDGECVGVGLGIIERGYIGIYGIFVKPNYRRKGFAKKIMNTLLYEAKERGVNKTYLQVVDSNTPAVDLYRKLGYKHQYYYWYRVK
ncbi:GNAT family N-acetyltransferase [Clostridiaceae bacterium M8S5]|nr:GNAT family N-acetyltransferase [Clostridiaceae bacterium M8S5]